MKIKTKRTLMLLLLLVGVVWNCLCVCNVLQLSLFWVSVVAVGGYSFIFVFAPLLFPSIAHARGISTYMHDLTEREKQMSGLTICLTFAWIVTLIACIA